MHFSRARLSKWVHANRLVRLALATLLLAWVARGLAGQVPAVDKKSPPPATPSQPGGPKGLENLKLPPDAVIVVCEQAADALRLLPRLVVLTPEKLKELQDEIERLRARTRPDQPAPPSLCHLEGRVEGQQLVFEARYDFVTDRPGALIALGCRQAQPTRALLDGKTPLLRVEPEGYVTQLDKPGDHHLTVQFTMALSVQGNSRALSLDLPRAAGTELKLNIPGEVRDLKVNDKALGDTLLSWKNGWLDGSHGPGPSDKLQLAWKSAAGNAGAPTVLTAEGRIELRIDERLVPSSEARLQLKVQGGQARQWRLLVPPGASLELLAPADPERFTIETQDLPGVSVRTIKLKDLSADPLAVKIVSTAAAPLPRTGPGRILVGPFALVGATRQTGSLLVSSAAAGLRLQVHRHGFTAPSEPSAEELRVGPLVHTFTYELPPLKENPPFLDRNRPLTLVEVEAETIRGQVETKVSHTLRLPRKEMAGDGRSWQVETTIEARLIQPGVSQLEVQLPPGWVFLPNESRLTDPVQEARLDEQRRVVQLRLTGDSWRPFKWTLWARQVKPVEDTGAEALTLPQPLGTLNGGGFQVVLSVADDLELLAPAQPNPLLEMTRQTPQEQVWKPDPTADRPATQAPAAWRPYRPDIRAASVVDVDLQMPPRESHVRQEIRLTFARPMPPRIALRVPAGVTSLYKGGQLLPDDQKALRNVEVKAEQRGDGGAEALVVLAYDFRAGEADAGPERAPFQVPLIDVDGAASTETRVRVWSEPGAMPAQVGGMWTEKAIEAIKERRGYPALVLSSHRLDQPLILRLAALMDATPVTVLVDRALVRVAVVDGVGQSYRASLRLNQLLAKDPDVELPEQAAVSGLEIKLDGKDVPYRLDATAEGQVAHLRLDPSAVKTGSILKIAYQLPPQGLGGKGGTNLLQTVLQPPILRGEPGRVLTRWQVQLPGGWVVLGPEGGPGSERVWVRSGWLLAPRLVQTTGDVERWLLADEPAARFEEGEGGGPPSLLCLRGKLAPLTVYRLPQQGWLLICSLGVLVLGLVVYFLSRQEGRSALQSPRFWIMLAVLALALATASVFWPTLTAAVLYGAQPGVVVLALACLVQWLIHEQQRRQIVFLPSFSRGRAGSSIVHSGPSSARRAKPHGEPSTIDAPRPISG